MGEVFDRNSLYARNKLNPDAIVCPDNMKTLRKRKPGQADAAREMQGVSQIPGAEAKRHYRFDPQKSQE